MAGNGEIGDLIRRFDEHLLRIDLRMERPSAAPNLASISLSEEALRAHIEEGTPGEPVTDPTVLAELFDTLVF